MTELVEVPAPKLAKASYSFLPTFDENSSWNPNEIDKLDATPLKKFTKVIEMCKFFYTHDPISSSVINKLVDISINELVYQNNDLTENELRIFYSIEPKLKKLAEEMALEYLLSGLVVPEISYSVVPAPILHTLGIKRYTTLILPDLMWIRNPQTIVIKENPTSGEPIFFYKVPDSMIYFITRGGQYDDNTEDSALYFKLETEFPGFVEQVKKGKTVFPVKNPELVLRRKPTSDSPFPVPYLYPALESLKHKRNLRRMDYAIAARVIQAVQQISVGSDEFPLVEEDGSDVFSDLKTQLSYNTGVGGNNVERVIQLFTNHTVKITWITPDVEALLNQEKYIDVNNDIIFALGFPRILITGESERSNSSDPHYATISPVKTMESFRWEIREVLQKIVNRVSIDNNLSSAPTINFAPLQLAEFDVFVSGLMDLYSTGNLSRKSYANVFGFDIEDELKQRAEENKLLKKLELEDFAPRPFTPPPGGSSDEISTETPKITKNKPPDTKIPEK